MCAELCTEKNKNQSKVVRALPKFGKPKACTTDNVYEVTEYVTQMSDGELDQHEGRTWSIRLRMEDKDFAHGGMRYAYKASELAMGDNPVIPSMTGRLVLKEIMPALLASHGGQRAEQKIIEQVIIIDIINAWQLLLFCKWIHSEQFGFVRSPHLNCIGVSVEMHSMFRMNP